mgnify:CR=1 FL=1
MGSMKRLRSRVRELRKLGLSSAQRRVQIIADKAMPKADPGIEDILSRLKSINPTARASGIRRLSRGYPHLAVRVLDALLRDPDVLVRTQAKVMLAHLGVGKLPELYGRALHRNDFTNASRGIVRIPQDKPEANTTLLGGKLLGKAVIKVMHPSNVEAWKRVLEAGIPAEPILKNRQGNYREFTRKNGRIAVSVKVLNGPTIEAFLQDNVNKRRYTGVIDEQIDQIKNGLEKIGVRHNHLTLRNFLVVWVMKKKKRYPKVFLIDFDKAEVAQRKP